MSAPARTGPLASVGYALHHAALVWRLELETRLRPLQLTHTQFNALATANWLARSGTLPTQQDIANFSGMDRMMTSKMIAVLKARGAIASAPDPTDARSNRIQVTEQGAGIVREATRIAREVDAELFGTAAAARELRETLATVAPKRRPMP
jgi:DNA-binding MarR family transcriptional regulator